MQTIEGVSLYKGKRDSTRYNLVLNVIIIIFALIFIAEIAFNAVYTSIYVTESSMLPTLVGAPNENVVGGDYIFVNTVAKPSYGDIVVVYNGNYNIIKRVVAFGGDTVRIINGQLQIKYSASDDFVNVEESYVLPENNDAEGICYNYDAHTVLEGHMFLLGDNRNVSRDSRDKSNGNNGDFSLSNLIGVVPQWAIKYKRSITSFYTYIEFKLGFRK